MNTPSPAVITVVVADDDALVRTSLQMILGGNSDIEVVAEAADGQQALDAVARTRPDIVLMDIRMPVMDGLVATERLVRDHSGSRVVVLTTFDTDDLVLTALRHGAAGFLLKDTPPAELVDAVRRVAAGQSILSPAITSQLIATVTAHQDTHRPRAQERLSRLTEREHEVALALARGLSNAEISAELYMGVATVKTHVARLFTKLDATNRVQIARCVHEAGLL